MLAFPNAKINLGLNIIAKRTDGYHDLESCFYPIPWHDALEIVPAEKVNFTASGLEIPGNPEHNLCLKAYRLLADTFNEVKPVHIHLHKTIPMGAGLGGGSSDGACTLKVLNDLFELHLHNDELAQFAARIGSDCPFFIENSVAIATGTGTDIEPFDLNLSGYHLCISHPGMHVGTAEAYANIFPRPPLHNLKDTLNGDMDDWKDRLVNDFETSIFPKYEAIRHLKEHLYRSGAIYASMTGSGSAVYGLFQQEMNIPGFRSFHLADRQLS